MKELLTLFRLTLVAAVAAGSFLAGRRDRSPAPPAAVARPIHSQAAPTLQAVQKLSSLVVNRVAVADVSQTRIEGYAGGVTAVVVIRGDFLLGVDLGAATFKEVDEKNRSAVLTLPPPAVSSPRLDQERTRVLSLTRQGLWALVPGDAGQQAVVNHALRHAQSVVAEAGTEPQLLAEARRRAESVLGGFFTAVGWKVVICWADGA